MNITGISVYIEVDGRQCFAPIKPECAELFVGMLPAFQALGDGKARMIKLPGSVWKHVRAAGSAMEKAIDAAQKTATERKTT